LCLISKLYYNL